MAISAVVTFVAADAALHARWATTVEDTGAELHDYAVTLAAAFEEPPPAPPLVDWFGDSTMMSGPSGKSWADAIAAQLRTRHVDGRSLAYPGRDFYHFYCALPRYLAANPSVVVFTANLRFFRETREDTGLTDTCVLPWDQVLRALTLPWYRRGITVPRLLLTQLLRFDLVRERALFYDALRSTVLWHSDGNAEPAAEPTRRERFQTYLRGMRLWREGFEEPFGPRSAVVRMMTASVRETVRRGAVALVVVIPVPREQLTESGVYDSGEFARRVAVIEDAVARAGGTVLDLHELLPQEEFRDRSGHFDPRGAARLANAVSPHVHRLLGLPPPARIAPTAPKRPRRGARPPRRRAAPTRPGTPPRTDRNGPDRPRPPAGAAGAAGAAARSRRDPAAASRSHPGP